MRAAVTGIAHRSPAKRKGYNQTLTPNLQEDLI
jgi:hypothetical protein